MSDDMPEDVRSMIKADLEFLSRIRGGTGSDLHERIFGTSSVKGSKYCAYLQSRIKSLVWRARGDYTAAYLDGHVLVTKGLLEESRIGRLGVLFHEAAHAEAPDHELCPKPFIGDHGKEMKAYRDSTFKLEDIFACDKAWNGSYGVQVIWLSTLVRTCTHCFKSTDEMYDTIGIIRNNTQRVLSKEARQLLASEIGR